MSPNEMFFSCRIFKSREIEHCVATPAANEASHVAPTKNVLSVMIKGRGKFHSNFKTNFILFPEQLAAKSKSEVKWRDPIQGLLTEQKYIFSF